jgi:hypothetical protein
MTFKGIYSTDVAYAVGDVVKYTDDVWYHAQKASPAGITPVNTLYWGRVDQELSDALDMVISAMEIVVPNVSDDAILLKSSSEGSTKEFLITVDDDGEITATEVE